ncbi:integrin beta-1-like isoform X2 [Corythoichthys intestinalis]|uniref:integrin beta-1-like isoform X2 n=1 Tax=Corythoichthys intestinalis TaxID=161448 RepID=UPI0025A5B772|nr:integrin beta-1-like isoform X2 [Corythoichthys intestinalis]
MAIKVGCLFLLLLPLLSLSWADEITCLKTVSSCSQCMLSGPQCVWCTAPNFKRRCNTLSGLQKAGCDASHMYNPQGSVHVTRNDSSNEPTTGTLFLQPQQVTLHLRPGVSQSFPLYITVARNQRTPQLNMDTSLMPAEVNITFSNIRHGNMIVEVNVEASNCHKTSDNSTQDSTGPSFVHITPRGFLQSLKLEIILDCECDCKGNREENSPSCDGHGDLVCGSCECYQPYSGQHCQINVGSNFNRDDKTCRQGPNAPLCSNRGTCVDGECLCHSQENPNERYRGMFCECSNFDCPFHNNRICGGHGSCECGQCICDNDWTGEDCSCTLDTTSCMASNQQLCNNQGLCQCGSCRCDPPYAGPTCESCPTCLGPCQTHAECVDCRVFGTGPKKDRCQDECNYLIVTKVGSKTYIDAPCKMKSREDSCYFYFSISQDREGIHCTAAAMKECP